jgi:hypothetical protein
MNRLRSRQLRALCTLFLSSSAIIAASDAAAAQPARPPAPATAAAAKPGSGVAAAAGPAATAPLAAAPAAEGSAAPAAPLPLSERLTGPAKEAYEAGKLLFRDNKDYDGALIKFRTAYETSKDPGLKWNMAACEKALKHYARTMQLLREYLAETAGTLSEDDQKAALTLIATCEQLTVNLRILVNEPEADVYVDDELVGKSPLASSVLVDIGARKIRVTKGAEYTEFSTEARVGGSREALVDAKISKVVHEGKLLVATQEDAMISVDGKLVGNGSYSGTLTSGGHSVKISAKDRKPFVSDVLIEDNKSRTLNVKLEREGTPSGVYWGIAGAVLVAGTATALIVYVATRPPDPTAGTFGSPGYVEVRRYNTITF